MFKKLFISIKQFIKFVIVLSAIVGLMVYFSTKGEDEYQQSCRQLGLNCAVKEEKQTEGFYKELLDRFEKAKIFLNKFIPARTPH